MSRDLLLEIGTEEIPARFLTPAVEQIKALLQQGLQEYRLAHGEVKAYGSPRRLAVLAKEVADCQVEKVEEVKGPSCQVAFTSDGQATKAAQGFARSRGVPVEDLAVRETPQGEYVFALVRQEGVPAAQVLPGLLHSLILGLTFPKTMRWGEGEMRFVRPIHWLVALWGDEVLPLALEQLQADRLTRGHRFLAPDPFPLANAGEYPKALARAFVLADQEDRQRQVWQQVRELAAAEGGEVKEDPNLLEEVTNLVEYPTALVGSMPDAFLSLPREVLITTMREHQRYFPVWGSEGRLLPRFITVRNGSAQHLEVVRAGNEKVLRARLEDASFFYQEDIKLSQAQRVEGLAEVVFLAGLGSLKDKVQRLEHLVDYLASAWQMPQPVRRDVQRAAGLAKSDLLTNMVYEFPELQGIMGSYYAAQDGEPEAVCQALREQYLPRFAGDELPQTPVGTMLAVADKMDTLVGCFGSGHVPTGSQDPYALRRQALGIILTLWRQERSLDLGKLVQQAYQGYGLLLVPAKAGEVLDQVAAFFRQRLEGLLIDEGLRYDEVRAVLAKAWQDPVNARQRVLALHQFRQEEGLTALLTPYNRAANLSRNAPRIAVDPKLFQDPNEGALQRRVEEVQGRVAPLLQRGAYREALEEMAGLAPVIDSYFTAVLVMADDLRVRANRLSLLGQVVDLMSSVAELSLLVED